MRTIIRPDGEEWWVLKDVCDALGVGNPSDVANRLDEDGENGIKIPRKLNIINRPGLYSMIIGKWIGYRSCMDCVLHTPKFPVYSKPKQEVVTYERLEDEY